MLKPFNSELEVVYVTDKLFKLKKDFYFYFTDEELPLCLMEALEGHIHINSTFQSSWGEYFICIPKDFITDFGSIPQFAQCILSPVGKATKAYVVHDYLCWNFRISRAAADYTFKLCLKKLGLSKWRRWALYYAVRLYAKVKGYK